MSSALYTYLVLDLKDGSGNPIVQGTAQLVPSLMLTDAPDQQVIPQAPLSVTFTAPGLPSQLILAPDSTGPQPASWGWTLSYSGVPGNPPTISIQPFAGPVSFTSTDADPAVFTFTPVSGGLSALPNGAGVKLSGSPPAGFNTTTTYYVVNASGDTFELSTTAGTSGTPVASTSTGSGTLTVVQYNLSSLPIVVPSAPMSGYLPIPTGTPAAGDVPVAVAGGSNQTAWGAGGGGGGGGDVTSVFGRAGVITAESGDYTASDVGALALPAGGTYPGGTTEFLNGAGGWTTPSGTVTDYEGGSASGGALAVLNFDAGTATSGPPSVVIDGGNS